MISYVAIGLSDHVFPLSKMPGWSGGKSWAYHGDEGQLLDGNEFPQKRTFLEKYSTGDVIGCGVNMKEHTAFFTKNRIYQGTSLSLCPKIVNPAIFPKSINRRSYSECPRPTLSHYWFRFPRIQGQDYVRNSSPDSAHYVKGGARCGFDRRPRLIEQCNYY